MIAPRVFRKLLKNYDPALRVRWAVRTAQWFIEVKLPERSRQLLSERPNPWNSPHGWDRYDGWREGYLHVLDVPPDKLEWSVVAPSLDFASIVATARITDITDQIERIEAEQEAAADRDIKTWAEDASSQAWDDLKWAWKQRVNVPVEIKDGFVVHDRRQVALGAS